MIFKVPKYKVRWRLFKGLMLVVRWMLILGLMAGGFFYLEEHQAKWDPQVLAVVNGQPITREAVNQVLKWGTYSGLGLEGMELEGAELEKMDIGGVDLEGIEFEGVELEADTVARILQKIIDQQLVFDAAVLSGFQVWPGELEEVEKRISSAWPDSQLSDQDWQEIRLVLARQLLQRRMTEQIKDEGQEISAEGWKIFWKEWPRSLPPRYQVRVLLLPPLPKVEDFSLSRWVDLEQMVDHFAGSGLEIVVSETMWISGPKQKPEIVQALEEAWNLGRLTDPIRMAESWAVYELLNVDRGSSPVNEYRAARAAYEEGAREYAFELWLNDVRRQADISINPQYYSGISAD